MQKKKNKKEKRENKREMTLEDGLKGGKMDFKKIETDGRNDWQQEELRPQGRLAVLTGGRKEKKMGENWMENDDDCGISHCLRFFPPAATVSMAIFSMSDVNPASSC